MQTPTGRSSRPAIALLLAMAPLWPATSAVAEPVRTSPARELFAAPGADARHSYFAWTRAARDRYHAYLSADGGSRILIDPPAAQDVFTGSIVRGGVILQTVEGTDSDVMRYDIATGSVAPFSDRTSDPRWQWRPTASGRWLLFGERRDDAGDAPWRVVLLREGDGETRILARAASGCRCIVPGQVNGDYAVWSRGSPGTVFRYRISTRETVRVPNPSDMDDHAPSVSVDGTVFFARSGATCGASAGLYRYGPDGTTTQLLELRPGRDVPRTSTFGEADGAATLYFDRQTCSTGQSDIMAIPSADTATRTSG